MKLLILFGAPSVGKATVGQLIEKMTDFKLFHNHMVMDGVMHIFGVGTPTEDRLSKLIRTEVIKEAAKSNVDLIFTYVWNFAHEKGRSNIDAYKKIYEDHGGEVIFVELTAPLATRVTRADHPDRKRLKKHAPDAKRVAHLEMMLDFESPSPFFYPNAYHHIDTNNLSPEQVAKQIVLLLG